MDPADHLTAILTEGARVASLPAESLSAPVPTCPDWDVAGLVTHLGRTHRWACSYLVAGPDGDRRQVPKGPPAPEGEAVLSWYRDNLEALVAELGRHQPTDPAGSFVGTTDVAFWIRRQAHETTMHRWDAENAVDPGGAEPVGHDLAVDGIDEWLSFFVPRFLQLAGGPSADLVGTTLHLHATDDGDGAGSPGEWLVRVVPEGVEVERTHAKGDAALRGPVSDLLLAAWHRLPLERLDVVGDAARARALLDAVRVT